MGHPPIEKLLPQAQGSIYKLSRLAGKRAAELAAGRKPLIECDSRMKTATIALEEIAAGAVVLKECGARLKVAQKPENTENSENSVEE